MYTNARPPTIPGSENLNTLFSSIITDGVAKLENGTLSNLSPPIYGTDGTNKNYVDALVGGSIKNIIIVQKEPLPGQFLLITDALNSIIDASINNQYLISIGPGIYIEDTLVMKNYVYLEGSGNEITEIEVNTATNSNIIGSDFSKISSCSFRGATSGIAIYHEGDGNNNPFEVDNCTFHSCETIAHAHGAINPTYLIISNCSLGFTYNYTNMFKCTNTSNIISELTLSSIVFKDKIPQVPMLFSYTSGINTLTECSNIFLTITPTTNTTGFNIENGAKLIMQSTTISGFDEGIKVSNVGSAPNINIQGVNIDNSVSYDLNIEHPSTFGSVNGSLDRLKTFIDPSSAITYFTTDAVNSSVTTVGGFYIGDTYPQLADISNLLIFGPTMGVINGGILSIGDTLTVNITAGIGYLIAGTSPDNYLIKVEWDASSLLLSANTNNYIYFNSNSILSVGSSSPNTQTNILLGRVVTDSSDILFIDATSMDVDNFGNKLDQMTRFGIGAIYQTGSLVSANASREITIGSGIYYFSSTKFTPTGIDYGDSFTSIYRNNPTGHTYFQ